MKRSKNREVGVHIEPHNVALAVRGEDLGRVADAAALRNGDIRDNSRDCRSLSLLADHPIAVQHDGCARRTGAIPRNTPIRIFLSAYHLLRLIPYACSMASSTIVSIVLSSSTDRAFKAL